MKKKSAIVFILSSVIALIGFYYFANVNEGQSQDRQISSTFLKFPEQFKWCVATSAHQIEGNNLHNDWWAWENLIPSKIKNADKSGMATDHWNRYAEDTQIMAAMGITQYRFSIEWSRIEPIQGNFDLEAIKHYRDEIIELKKNGIAPMVTLHHFTSPKWFADLGGWGQKDSVVQFRKYVEFVNKNLGSYVETWITFNEPMVMIAGGYVDGVFPPGIRDWEKVALPVKHILLAHGEAYRELHKNKLARVGIAHHLRVMHAYHKTNPIEWYLAHKLSKSFNWAIPNALKDGELSINIPTKIKFKEKLAGIKGTQDFLGVNYYSRDMVKFTPKGKDPLVILPNEKSKKTDINWEIYPEGFGKVLEDIHNIFPDLPIYITENGLADKDDKNRTAFIRDHLIQVHKAIAKGMPIKGYCHWSLMDNFEWAEGYHPRFGLYHVDYKTFERTPRKSALYYKSIIEKNGFSPSEI
jgi:beta-glucosidase